MRVLLVEDDPMIGQATAQALTDAAHAVDWVRNGTDGMAALRESRYDLLLLDLGLGKVDGVDVLRSVRQHDSGLPVMVVTAREHVVTRGSGAPVLSCGELTIDPATRQAAFRAARCRLSGREFALMEALVRRPGAILSKSELEERIYGWNQEVDSNTVEVLVHGLRRKLGVEVIRTVRGVGYMVDPAP
jgi:two-component system OmpR family response regulator